MNEQKIKRGIVLYVVLPGLMLYFGMRLFAQYRHVDVYVSRAALMPVELSSKLHMEEHKIDPRVIIETPYDRAEDKILPMDEIQRIRSQIAWSKAMPAFIDSLTIQSTNRVLARRTTRRVMLEYQLIRRGDRWWIEDATRLNIRN
jgi:hypothetical protein